MIHFDNKLDYTNISIGEYIELQDLLLDNTDGLEQQDLVMQEIQILYGRDPYKMSMPEFKKAVESLSFLSKEMPKMKIKDSYFLNGNQYVLHKKLSEFKVAHYIDYEMIMKNQKGIESYPEFLALFLIPEGYEYNDGYSMETVVKDIRKYMSIADACSIAAFFFRQSRAFIVASLLSSRRKAMKAMKGRKKKKELRKKMNQLIKMTIFGESLH